MTTNAPIEQFQDAAQRIAAACGLQWLDVGAVAIQVGSQWRALALRVAMVRSEFAPISHEFGQVCAYRFAIRLHPGTLAGVCAELSGGHLRLIDRLTLDLGPPGPAAIWHYSDNGVDSIGTRSVVLRSAQAIDTGGLLRDAGIEHVDRLIYTQSQHRVPSLDRLVRVVTDTQQFQHRNGSFGFVELSAPWPIQGLSIDPSGKSGVLRVSGLAGLALERQAIVNVEGRDEDIRLSADDIAWHEVPEERPMFSSYLGQISRSIVEPRAVNVFFAGVDEVALRGEVRQAGQGWNLLRNLLDEGAVAPLVEGAANAHLVELRVAGYRSLGDVTLSFTPLTVIAGRNQAGKSTLLDAIDLLAETARGRLLDAISSRGGFPQLLHRGAGFSTGLAFFATFDAGGRRVRYELEIGPYGTHNYAVEAERFIEVVEGNDVVALQGGRDRSGLRDDPHALLLTSYQAASDPLVQVIRAALASMAVFPWFRLGAAWAAPQDVPMRRPGRPDPAARLSPLGDNLVSALLGLQGRRDDWQRLTEILKMVFDDFEGISFAPGGVGTLELRWSQRGISESFVASELSDGTLHLLACLCALFEGRHSLVAIDEPEKHLHPDALYRLVAVAQSLSGRQTVLFATQSDRLLDYLDEQPEAIVVARRGPQGTRLVRPERDQLAQWLAEFRLSEMRPELEAWGQE